MEYLLKAGVTLVQFVVSIYMMFVLLRFLFQLVRADFHNPLSQAIVTVTNPPLKILRKIVPGFGGIDWPSVILLFSLQGLEISLLALWSTGSLPSPLGLIILCLAHLLQLTAYVYMVAIFVIVIISWINPGAYSSVTVLIYQLTNPLMRRVRRHIPSTAGLDWSPMVVLLGIYLFLSLVVAPLMDLGIRLSG